MNVDDNYTPETNDLKFDVDPKQGNRQAIAIMNPDCSRKPAGPHSPPNPVPMSGFLMHVLRIGFGGIRR